MLASVIIVLIYSENTILIYTINYRTHFIANFTVLLY